MRKNPHAVALGKRGNKRRNELLSAEERREIATRASKAAAAKRIREARERARAKVQ